MFNDKKSKTVLNNTGRRPAMGIQAPRKRKNFILICSEKRNRPEIRKEMITYKFRIQTTPKSKLANDTMLNCFVLMSEFCLILSSVVVADFMRKLFFQMLITMKRLEQYREQY